MTLPKWNMTSNSFPLSKKMLGFQDGAELIINWDLPKFSPIGEFLPQLYNLPPEQSKFQIAMLLLSVINLIHVGNV